MNKDALDAIGEVIKTAMAGSDARIRRLENELALLNDNHAAAIKALESKHQAALDAIQQKHAALDGRLAVCETEAKALSEVVDDVKGVNIVVLKRIEDNREAVEAKMAGGNLELLGLIEAIEKKADDNAAFAVEVAETLALLGDEVEGAVRDVREVGEALEQTAVEVKALDARVGADTKSHPMYVEGEVVRKGGVRRFGFGGLFEAAYDTAKGVLDAPDAWVMLSDGLIAEESDTGLRLKSFSGNIDTLLHHGSEGKQGQRGKEGAPGLRGNDGNGIADVVVSEHGMFLELTSGKSFVFDFTKPLEHAINEVAPVIESIALKAIAKQGAP